MMIVPTKTDQIELGWYFVLFILISVHVLIIAGLSILLMINGKNWSSGQKLFVLVGICFSLSSCIGLLCIHNTVVTMSLQEYSAHVNISAVYLKNEGVLLKKLKSAVSLKIEFLEIFFF